MIELNLITILTFVFIFLSFIKFWFNSKGQLSIVYKLDIIVYSICMILETILALKHPEQFSIIFINILYIWAIIMAIKGHFRLKKEINNE